MYKLAGTALLLVSGTVFAAATPSSPDTTPTDRETFSTSVTDPDAFDRWDADGNGMIDYNEWEQAEIDDEFERWDTNRDGFVGPEERDRAIIDHARG